MRQGLHRTSKRNISAENLCKIHVWCRCPSTLYRKQTENECNL